MPQTDTYHLGVGAQGKSRRLILNQLNNPSTAQFLLNAGLKPGMKVLDIGCGMGIMSCWIAEQVGPQGEVIGIDRSDAQLEIAKELACEEELDQLKFQQLDAKQLDQLDSGFDFIYSRFLLIHMQNPKNVIQSAFNLLKPKGIFSCQSSILGTEMCYPDNPAFNRWCELRSEIYKKLNKDPKTGAKIHTLMAEQGFTGIHSKLLQPVLNSEIERQEMMVNDLLEQERALIKAKLCREEDIVDLKEQLQELAHDRNSFIAYHQSCQISGQKPA